MKLTLKRIAFKPTYTIGKLYINDEYFCDTLEDVDRGLTLNMSDKEISDIKVYSKTCIPYGEYKVVTNVVSGTFSQKPYYKKFCLGKLPRLLDVPGFEGILIHIGNTDKDSAGCILVGLNEVVGLVINSTTTFEKLYKKLKENEGNVSINIIK